MTKREEQALILAHYDAIPILIGALVNAQNNNGMTAKEATDCLRDWDKARKPK